MRTSLPPTLLALATLLVPAVLVDRAAAQTTTFTLPTSALVTGNTNVPLSAGIGRYQQWFSAAELTASLTEPMRIQRLQFFAGSGQTANATTLDAEVSIGHGFGFGLSGLFDNNFDGPKLTVFPRGTLQLLAGGAGSPVVTVNFPVRFTWDGVSPVVIELKIYGNGRGNTSFPYDFSGTPQAGNRIQRVYQGGNANAMSGVQQQGQGLFVGFEARPGVTVPFGNGCRGTNLVEPVCSVNQIPWPGISWQHQLSNAASQRLCVLVLGLSNTQAGGTPPVPLPFDLAAIGANGCFLLVDPAATFFATTVGSPGTGSATVPIALPPLTFYIGSSLYTQWLVADPGSPNGVLSATAGIRSIVAPVGG